MPQNQDSTKTYACFGFMVGNPCMQKADLSYMRILNSVGGQHPKHLVFKGQLQF